MHRINILRITSLFVLAFMCLAAIVFAKNLPSVNPEIIDNLNSIINRLEVMARNHESDNKKLYEDYYALGSNYNSRGCVLKDPVDFTNARVCFDFLSENTKTNERPKALAAAQAIDQLFFERFFAKDAQAYNTLVALQKKKIDSYILAYGKSYPSFEWVNAMRAELEEAGNFESFSAKYHHLGFDKYRWNRPSQHQFTTAMVDAEEEKVAAIVILGDTDKMDKNLLRVINFPPQYSVGFVDVGTSQPVGITWESLGTAKNDLTIPKDKLVLLEISRDDLKHLSSWNNIKAGDIYRLCVDGPLSEQDVAQITRVANTASVKELRLTSSNLDDNKFREICQLKSLEYLGLHDESQITSEGFINLKNLNSLKTLGLVEFRFEPDMVSYINKIASLKKLTLMRCKITADSLEKLIDGMDLQGLAIDGANVSVGCLNKMTKIKSLKSLWLGNMVLDRECIQVISQMKSLELLSLDNTGIDDTATLELCKLVNLKSLSLWGTKLSNEGVSRLSALNLERLDLGNTKINDESFQYLKKMSKLKTVGLMGDNITSEGLQKLADSKTIDRISVKNNQIDVKIMEHYKRVMPNKHFTVLP